jgi:malate dehydrogenase (oxaloacetate-decarboxylating)(NADP+)
MSHQTMDGAPPPRLRGAELLRDPRFNKGTAFDSKERAELRLRGLLPHRVFTLEEQAARVMRNLEHKPDPLERYLYLAELADRNETVFYRALVDHVAELLPIVYTPTVGEACKRFAHIYTRPRGMYLTLDDRGRIAAVLRNWNESGVRVIVVTDGGRILGLGDLGANGIGIPIGKLALYTALGGVAPHLCLPIVLDVGTDNRELLDDPLYIGVRRPRARGAEYSDFVDEFVAAANEVFPGLLIQFEDFATENAFGLLARHRERVCCFNDDIQGTAAVVLAGLEASARITGRALADQRLLFLGAGAAGVGIATLIVSAMVQAGVSESQARARCWFVDSKGLVCAARTDLAPHKRAFAHEHAPIADLVGAVRALQPTALLGLSAQAGAFDEASVRAMAEFNERPLVFALSNPTSKAECTAEQAYRWTGGRAVFASGSPWAPVELDGRTHVPGQGNNAYIFPGVGLGLVASRARRVTDEVFLVAARRLAQLVPQASLDQGSLYPPLEAVRAVSFEIGCAVAELVWKRGLAEEPEPADVRAFVGAHVYEPRYVPYLAP